MVIDLVRKVVLYLKEVQDISLFAVMTDARLFALFAATPLYYIMLPFIGVLMLVLATLNGIELANTKNKNVDQWLQFSVSVICGVLASTSLFGSAIANILGITFIAGPWIFLASALVAFTHQIIMLGLNSSRALQTLPESYARKHYIQAVLSHVFAITLLSSVIGSIVFVMLFPIAPAAALGFPIAAVSLVTLNVLWRMMPDTWKSGLKSFLMIEKPFIMQYTPTDQDEPKSNITHPPVDTNYSTLFSKATDYSAIIQHMTLDLRTPYLQRIINDKIEVLNQIPEPDAKIKDKLSVLTHLDDALKTHTPLPKDLLQKSPLELQSFWRDKRDVQQIYEAVQLIQSADEEMPEETVASNVY